MRFNSLTKVRHDHGIHTAKASDQYEESPQPMSDCLDALYQCRSNHGSSDAMNVSQVPSAVCALQIAQQFAAKAANRLSQQ